MITAIVRDSDGRIMAFNNAGHGTTERNEPEFSTVKLPSQDVDKHYESDGDLGESLKEIYYPDDVVTWDEAPEQRKQQIIRELEQIDADYHSDRSWRGYVINHSADFSDTRVQHFKDAEARADELRQEYDSL